MNLGGSGLNSANHAAHERMNAAFGVKTTYIPFKGTVTCRRRCSPGTSTAP